MERRLYLVSPPGLKGRTNERSQSGGLGVARKLKPFEKEPVEVVAHDFLYQAAVAERAGHQVQIVDLVVDHVTDHANGMAVVAQKLAAGRKGSPTVATWIGVRMSITSLRSDIRFANRLKAEFPDATVYAFGSVLMTTYRHWIGEASFDYLFFGEPESIIEEAMAAEDPATVEGVISVAGYVDQDEPGLYDESSTSLYLKWRKVPDLNSLPRAAWHLVGLDRYAPGRSLSTLGLNVEASRGCFMPCTMCPYNLIEGRAMRFRTPESVLEEIEYLYRTFGIRHISFRDPNFAANKPQVRALAEGLIKMDLPIGLAAELSLELLDRPLLELMHRAGIRTLLTGVESDVPEIMKTLGQNTKINRILEEKVPICDELGIKLWGFFLIGTPEETWHTVRHTWKFARSLGIEATMTILTPFPGTPIYWRALREDLLVRGKEMTYEDWNSYTATMRTYVMSLRDVKLARTWARLETYVPYRWNQLTHASARRKLRGVAHLAPRVAVLGALRAYAAFKLFREGRRALPSTPFAPGHGRSAKAEGELIPLSVVGPQPDDSRAPVAGVATRD